MSLGGLLDVLEAEALVGVDVEDDALGLFDHVAARAPDVPLERVHLHAADEARGIVDVEVLVVVGVGVEDHDLLEAVGEAAGVVLLEELLALDARRARGRGSAAGRAT